MALSVSVVAESEMPPAWLRMPMAFVLLLYPGTNCTNVGKKKTVISGKVASLSGLVHGGGCPVRTHVKARPRKTGAEWK